MWGKNTGQLLKNLKMIKGEPVMLKNKIPFVLGNHNIPGLVLLVKGEVRCKAL